MPGAHHRKHTPITSEAQRGFFGAVLARRRRGQRAGPKSLKTKDIRSHLHEAKGKNLPKRAH